MSRNEVEARYQAGLKQLLDGQPQAALPDLEFAAGADPRQPVYQCNLGEARRRLGDTAGAIAALERALRLKSDYPIARFNLGCALLGTDAAAALKHFEALVSAHPQEAKYLAAAGDALRELGRHRAAIERYRRALALEPDHALAHSNLGGLLLQGGRAQDALEHCRRAVELAPADYRVHQNLGRCLVETEALDDAMTAYARAHELAPESAELSVSIGDVWRGVGEVHEAHFWYDKALSLDPRSLPARSGQAMLLLEAGDSAAAVARLRELVAEQPDRFGLQMDLSQALWDEGSTEDAIEAAKKGLALQPESAALHSHIGAILASAGKVDEAIQAHQTALEHNPNCVAALSGLATTQRTGFDPTLADRMNRLLQGNRLRDGARANLHAGLAAWHDARKDAEGALLHAREANRCQWAFKSRHGWEYDPAEHAAQVRSTLDVFDAEFFARTAGFGVPDETPVFIVGMPRSGTTLTEQILASHPHVLGIGERNFAGQALSRLQQLTGQAGMAAALAQATPPQIQQLARDYLEKLAQLKRKLGKPDARFVVDKMPDNYSNVGWILTLFPNARILHARRDLRDVAWSCWLTQFGQIRWACDMQHIAERIREYLRVMAHWDRVLPGRLLGNDYEELVAQQEPQTRRLLDWLGLPWDPACLQFHKTERIVRTASVSQVRKPMYSRSVARWKPYEAELQPVIDVMREAGLPL